MYLITDSIGCELVDTFFVDSVSLAVLILTHVILVKLLILMMDHVFFLTLFMIACNCYYDSDFDGVCDEFEINGVLMKMFKITTS